MYIERNLWSKRKKKTDIEVKQLGIIKKIEFLATLHETMWGIVTLYRWRFVTVIDLLFIDHIIKKWNICTIEKLSD